MLLGIWIVFKTLLLVCIALTGIYAYLTDNYAQAAATFAFSIWLCTPWTPFTGA